jgi:hypothetical protein
MRARRRRSQQKTRTRTPPGARRGLLALGRPCFQLGLRFPRDNARNASPIFRGPVRTGFGLPSARFRICPDAKLANQCLGFKVCLLNLALCRRRDNHENIGNPTFLGRFCVKIKNRLETRSHAQPTAPFLDISCQTRVKSRWFAASLQLPARAPPRQPPPAVS